MDFVRSAHFMASPDNPPSRFPLPTQVAARYYWLHERDCGMAGRLPEQSIGRSSSMTGISRIRM